MRPEPLATDAPPIQEDPLTPMDATLLQWIIPVAGIAAVLFAIYLARDVLSRDKGPQAMQDVADTIREGADAFIRRLTAPPGGCGWDPWPSRGRRPRHLG